jgi:hypothetical protein
MHTPPFEEQQRRNRQSREAWALFAPHRARVTELIVQQIERLRKRGQARVAVLGAGNLNDLDLQQLAPACESLDLIDLDGEALADGLARQSPALIERVRLRGGVDLSRTNLNEVEGAAAASDSSSLFDVVASTCLLSQLLEPLVTTVSADQPLPLDAIQSLRQRHVQSILAGLKPGGQGLLITDVVSSVTCESLATTRPADLPVLLQRLIAERNFFTGLNPRMIEQMLRTAPGVVDRIATLDTLDPWLWNLGPRVYLVCGWRMEASGR